MLTRACMLMTMMTTSALAADASALSGTWTAERAERDGSPAAELVGHRLSLTADRFEIRGPDGRLLYAGTFTADAGAQPARIDFRNEQGEAAGQVWEGIWRLEGDQLTIVDDAPDPAKGRPTDFTTAAGSGRVMLDFAR